MSFHDDAKMVAARWQQMKLTTRVNNPSAAVMGMNAAKAAIGDYGHSLEIRGALAIAFDTQAMSMAKLVQGADPVPGLDYLVAVYLSMAGTIVDGFGKDDWLDLAALVPESKR